MLYNCKPSKEPMEEEKILMNPITQDVIDTITHRIVQAVQPKKVILFGSYAWGDPNVDSDVDLFVIVASSDEPGYRRARSVYAALRGVRVPIDLIVKTQEEVRQSASVVTSLTKKVLEQGKVLYG